MTPPSVPRSSTSSASTSSAVAVGAEAEAQFSHRDRIVILVGLMLGMFLAALDTTIIATALPRIAADLHGVEHLSWVVSSYLLTSTAATPVYGKLSDLYGRKVMLQIAIVVFVLTSALCALSATMAQLIAFRALQGLGGGGLIAMAHATIADIISPRERGRYQGYIASTFAAASVLGPVLGGLFVDHLTWRWVFWINLPIGVGALVMAQVTLRGLVARRLRHRIDYPGALLIVAAVLCLLLVTTMGGNEVPWTSPVIAGLTAAALIFGVLAVFQELRASEPILPPRLFANRVYVVANLINMLVTVGLFGTITFLPLFLQLVGGLSAGDSGLMLMPLTVSQVAGAICAGRLVAATGRYKIFPVLGVACTGAGMLLLSVSGGSLLLAGAAMVLCGAGIGLVMPVMVVAVQNAVDVRDLGTATSSISFFRSIGGSFGVALFGAVLLARLDALVGIIPGHEAIGPAPGVTLLHAGAQAIDLAPAALRSALAAAIDHAFGDLFLVGAGIALLTFVAALMLKELPLKTSVGAAAGSGEAGRIAAAAGDDPEARPPR